MSTRTAPYFQLHWSSDCYCYNSVLISSRHWYKGGDKRVHFVKEYNYYFQNKLQIYFLSAFFERILSLWIDNWHGHLIQYDLYIQTDKLFKCEDILVVTLLMSINNIDGLKVHFCTYIFSECLVRSLPSRDRDITHVTQLFATFLSWSLHLSNVT